MDLLMIGQGLYYATPNLSLQQEQRYSHSSEHFWIPDLGISPGLVWCHVVEAWHTCE